ncbi:PhzF family phenazine biosynthesis protein [Denitrobaculum tricleocarpae]|uniref:PhzF family phenazine biosynthesis protein n=1 Tax=Denitrobaculum tricleocarpae TaxID=2591009 RepID=A0A545T7Y9_9PROT|nr:PhzF family phenazine biosynthesis protein [Denitrobaculum tricleocarpae]TQV73330.1 PhzF family phenazine biosynthesis protein [Denitrobaculum tricleocarpae]
MDVSRIAAFSENNAGGNPAGVAFVEAMPPDAEMLKTAAEIGYSETAFLTRTSEGWRVRYFAPESEVPFCGHATIATGAALGQRFGAGTYKLELNDANITVEAEATADGGWGAALQSPKTWSKPAPEELKKAVLAAFGLTAGDLDTRLPVTIANGGASHLVIALASRGILADMSYPYEEVKSLMTSAGLTTISLIWAENDRRFHARNPFPVGGVYEDPATGAAAAALGGFLRDHGWLKDGGTIEILQGHDMGAPSALTVTLGPTKGESVRVSGGTHVIG